MPSLLSRLRSRGISLPTSNASLSTAPVAPTSANSIEPPLTSPDHITPNISPVDRKIHPNLDSLLDDYSIQLDHDRDRDQIDASAEFGTRLNPSTLRRHSVDGGHPKTRPSLANTTTTPGTLDDADENIESTASRSGLIGELFTQDSALGDDPSRTRRILDHISYLASPSEWSTFGRHRDHKSPRLGSFGRQIPHVGTHSHDSNDFHIVTRRPRSNSKRKATGMNASSSEHSESFVTSKRSGSISRPSTAATAPITSREVASTTPSRKSSFKHPRGQDHEIRTTDCKYSSGSSSYRNNHAAMTPIRSLQNTSSSATHDILSDSPHTFGYPTPPDHASGFTFGPKSAYDSSPPPLPPFNHPELTAALRARSGTGSAANATVLSAKGLSPQDPDTIFESTHDRTFPRRSRFGSTNPAFASLPSFSLDKLRSRSKSSPSLPQVQQIFGPPSSPSASPPVPPPGSSRVKVHPRKCASGPRLRPRTNTLPVRRSSANWAKEATSRDQFSWPAQVSREILRLSFETYSAGSGRESRERGQHVISQGNPSSPHTNDLFLFESLGSPFLEAGALGHNLSDTLPFDHSMDGKDKAAPIPSPVVSSIKATDGSKVAREGKASERRATPSPPKKGSANSTTPSSSSLRTTALSGPSLTSKLLSDSLPRSATRADSSAPRDEAIIPVEPTASAASTVSKGKRKAEDVEGTPPDQKKEQRATFAIPPDPRPHRASATSGSSHAPSSYHRKRPRLTSTPLTSPPESLSQHPDAGNTGSWSSRASSARPPLHTRPSSHAASRAASALSNPADKPPRQSMSQVSIPISALISPHAPSVSRSSTFHMSDPRKPPRRQDTGWALRFGTHGEPGSGSPLHAWCFFVGFLLFPVWWVASFWSTPKTRRVGGTDMEKAVTLDDPQVEHDANSWRLRCRVMSVVSFFTYVPFIVLVVIFVHH